MIFAVGLGVTAGCGPAAPEGSQIVAVTYNTGTTAGLPHDAAPDDGYDQSDAAISDEWYGDGLAWNPAIEAVSVFFDDLAPDVVAFQEIFHPGLCSDVPSTARAGFVCDGWVQGDPTVAQLVLGEDYQVACHLGKPDKCLAVRRSFGAVRGCDQDLCIEGLQGSRVDGCGGGSRVGRAVIDRVVGDPITVVSVHGSSGLSSDDKLCRVRQFEQVFVDLGDGEPGTNGAINLVLGDLNTDPGRFADVDISAARFNDFVGEGEAFDFISDVGPQAAPSYQGLVNIDHVVSDRLAGDCWIAGVSDGRDPVTNAVYFDHSPVVCRVQE